VEVSFMESVYMLGTEYFVKFRKVENYQVARADTWTQTCVITQDLYFLLHWAALFTKDYSRYFTFFIWESCNSLNMLG
jgi:hypothetical protein